MKFVSFLDSFFILSLGITFSLLLGLIYHFRNRLNENEKKYEQLLSIVNDIVKKLNELPSSHSHGGNTIDQNIYYNNEVEEIYLDDEDDDITNSMHETLDMHNFEENYSGDNEEEDEEDEEEDEEDEEEDEEDEEEDEEDEDEEEDEEDEEEDEEDEDEEEDEEDEEEDEEDEDLEIMDETLSEDGVKLVNLNDITEIDGNAITMEEEEELIIDEPEVVNIRPLNDNISVKVEKSLDVNYHLLNVVELKKIIKEKEINASISKMKKQDLIHLLESNE